ncbi:MAG: putative 2-dehydropantoate 2-reductase [Bacteroidaceae bacterium]
MRNLKYAVIGSGAIGGFYGGKLANAGHDVHFLFHKDYEHAAKNGLCVDSVNGNFNILPINAYRSTTNMPPCDVILVCLKTTQNHILPDLLQPIIKAGTCIIMIQNGLGMESDLSTYFPDNGIVGAMAFICSNKIGPGHINHLHYGALTIANFRNTSSGQMEEVAHDFISAGVPVRIADSLLTARWRKLVWNIPYNGLSVVLHSQTDKLNAQPNTRQLLTDLMSEVIDAANACGANIPVSFASEMIKSTDSMKPYSPSMLLDYERQQQMEIQYMYSNPIRSAAEYGFIMKKTEVLEQQLRYINEEKILK